MPTVKGHGVAEMLYDHRPPEERKKAYYYDGKTGIKAAFLGFSVYGALHLVADSGALELVKYTGILSVVLHLSAACLLYGLYCLRKHNTIKP